MSKNNSDQEIKLKKAFELLEEHNLYMVIENLLKGIYQEGHEIGFSDGYEFGYEEMCEKIMGYLKHKQEEYAPLSRTLDCAAGSLETIEDMLEWMRKNEE